MCTLYILLKYVKNMAGSREYMNGFKWFAHTSMVKFLSFIKCKILNTLIFLVDTYLLYVGN